MLAWLGMSYAIGFAQHTSVAILVMVLTFCICKILYLAHWFEGTLFVAASSHETELTVWKKCSYDLFSTLHCSISHTNSFFAIFALSLLNANQANLSIQTEANGSAKKDCERNRIQAFGYRPLYRTTSLDVHKKQSIWFGLRKHPLRVHKFLASTAWICNCSRHSHKHLAWCWKVQLCTHCNITFETSMCAVLLGAVWHFVKAMPKKRIEKVKYFKVKLALATKPNTSIGQ